MPERIIPKSKRSKASEKPQPEVTKPRAAKVPDWQKLFMKALDLGAPNRPNPFMIRMDAHPAPPKAGGLAQDAALNQHSNWATSALAQDTAVLASNAWGASVIATAFAEGVQFLGYPYLSMLAQRPEYRVISQTYAEEMTRKWGHFEARGDDETQDTPDPDEERLLGQAPQQPEVPGMLPAPDPLKEMAEKTKEKIKQDKAKKKAQRIAQLTEMFNELDVKGNCKELILHDGFYGRGHLYCDTGDTDNRDELRTSIGSGKDALSKLKITPEHPLQRVATVEPVWCYPTSYDSVDPLKPDWYKPRHWFVMGKEVHSSRLLTFVGNEVPDLLKPAYSFGGLSMSQMAQPYVNNWLQTRQSVNDLIQAFVVWGLKTNLSESLAMEGNQLFARIELFNRLRNNRGIMVLDKDTEEFFNVTATLSGLEALQAQAQEHMASVSRIPLVKLLGIQPTGLNASSEGEIRVFYDTIAGKQESFLTKNVTRLMHFCMLSLWGEIDDDIFWVWEPLWELTEKELAETDKVRADTAQVRIDTGVIDKMEERRRLAQSRENPYPGLDPNFEPDIKEEEEEGLVPKGSGGGMATKEAMEEGTGEGEEDPEGEAPESETPTPEPPKPQEEAPPKPSRMVKPGRG